MATPYKRSFSKGRQNDQFLTDDMHKIYETVHHLSEKNDNNAEPELKLHGALWRDDESNELKYANKTRGKWMPVFGEKFQIIDHMLETTVPSAPVKSQLWIHDGVLYYFDGLEWRPIKAAVSDDNQWGIGAFGNFTIVSPLQPVGWKTYSLALDDDFYEHFYKSNADYKGKNEVVVTKKSWTPDWQDPVPDPEMGSTMVQGTNFQYILPSVDNDRFFLNDILRHDFTRISGVALSYPAKDVIDKTATGIHVNPSKLIRIDRRMVKVDKLNPVIKIPFGNTEFYGFRNGETGGHYLRPGNANDGDYLVAEDHIVLSYAAAQNYDYVVGITYTFGWIRDTGRLKVVNEKTVLSGYYIKNLKSPTSVFVDGLKLEEQYYGMDGENHSVTINDKNFKPKKQHVDFLNSIYKEYGYIRETTIDGYGIIKPNHDFKRPLVFINGIAMHPLLDGLVYKDNDVIWVPNAKVNMPWTIIELDASSENMSMLMEYGLVNSYYEDIRISNTAIKNDNLVISQSEIVNNHDLRVSAENVRGDKTPCVHYSPGIIRDTDGIILFVNGFLIPKSELKIDRKKHTVTFKGLKWGAQYILLRDPSEHLYDDLSLLPALNTGPLDDVLIYLNGLLLSDYSPIREYMSPEWVQKNRDISNGEVRMFVTDASLGTGEIRIWNEYNKRWDMATVEEAKNIMNFCGSYQIGISSVQLNVTYSSNDTINVYAFKFANNAVESLKIGDLAPVTENNPDGTFFKVGYPYIQGRNQVNIFCNGVKLLNGIDFVEQYNGELIRITNKELLKPGHRLVYVIEPLENGNLMAAEFVNLVAADEVGPSVYKIPPNIKTTFYPGRITVYLNGVRLRKDDWNILSNDTILIKNTPFPTLGNNVTNYPDQTYVENDGRMFTIHHNRSDTVSVEIRQEFSRKEKTFLYPNDGSSEIKLSDFGIDADILESTDEVLVYVNGLFTALTRTETNHYRLDPNKEAFTITNPPLLEQLNKDLLWDILRRNDVAYTAWKIKNDTPEYPVNRAIKNYITLVWR